MPEATRLLAYARVSTTEQADSGLGLDAQRHYIEVWAQAQRVAPESLHWFVDGGRSGSTMDRPDLQRLLGALRRGDRLVVAKLDRLSRSLLDFAELLQRSQREGWAIVALDLGTNPRPRRDASWRASWPPWLNGSERRSVRAPRTRWRRRNDEADFPDGAPPSPGTCRIGSCSWISLG